MHAYAKLHRGGFDTVSDLPAELQGAEDSFSIGQHEDGSRRHSDSYTAAQFPDGPASGLQCCVFVGGSMLAD